MAQFHSPRNIARTLDVAEITVRRWCWTGQLPYTRVGRLIRVQDADLRRFLTTRGRVPA